ncbi:MAG: M56 family metallopeptidase [Limisphaerales bacterium]
MLWQSSVLIAILFVADFALRRRVRAAVRYALWLVLLVKLLLPPSLALPTGVAWWLLPAAATANPHTTRFVVSYGPDTAPSLPPQSAPVFTSTRSPMSVAAWAILAWSAISAGLLVWLAMRWRQILCDVKRATLAPAWLDELFNAAKSSIGLRRTVRLRLMDQAISPAVCGLFQPVILLPQSLVKILPPAQLRVVLLHELTHLRRGDVWMNCAQALVQIAYWWHPLLWFANARIRRLREEAVDDAVMLALRDDAETYAPTLLEVAKLAFHRPLASLGLVGILESRSALRQRIERLINFRAPRKAGLTLVSLCSICIFSAVAVPMGEATAPSSEAGQIAPPAFSGTTNKPASNADTSANLYTRAFMVNPNPGLANLRKKTGLTESSPPDEYLRGFSKLMSTSGTTLPPTSLWLKENGLLLVRGTPQQLDAIEQIVLELNGFLARKTPRNTDSGAIIDNTSPTTAETGSPTNLETRTFKLDPIPFYQGVESMTGQSSGSTDISLAARQLFTTLGLNLDPPKSVFFNGRLGVLFVRATGQDLDTVEKVVQVLNYAPPPQIHIKGRFIETSAAMSKGLRTDFIPIAATNVAGVLTGPNLRVVLHALEQNPGTETLAEPEVTTVSGRQTQMRATDVLSIVTNFVAQETGTNLGIMPQQAQVELGPVLDTVASVLSDGYTIDLKAIASLTEFLGYDTPTNSIPTRSSSGESVTVPAILPRFRFRQAETQVKLRDGQTVVLGNLQGRFLINDKEVSAKPDTDNKTVLVLITVTLVDPAGNRIHSDDDMLIAPNGIPLQDSH